MSLNDRLPSLRSLLIFEAAAHHLSFTGAAAELGSTQSSVSQQIAGLERKTGCALFRRIYRGVALTDEGRKLFEVTQKSFLDIQNCLDQLQHQHSRRSINLATDFSIAGFWLIPRMPLFRREFPEIDVRVMTSQGTYDFNAQDVDVAILFSRHQPDHGSAWRLFDEEVFPVCSPSALDKYGPVRSCRQLSRLPLLNLDTDAGQEWMDWTRYFAELECATEPSRPALAFNNYTLLIQAAIAGQGIGIGWAGLVDELLAQGILVEVEGFRVRTSGAYYVLDPRPEETLSAKRQILDWLHQ